MPIITPTICSDKIGEAKRLEWAAEKFFVTTEEEPLFDAADVLRFGRDLVVQHGFTTNLKGIDWLRATFPSTGFTRSTSPAIPTRSISTRPSRRCARA